MKKIIATEEKYYRIKELQKGEFVRMSKTAKKTYILKGYERDIKLYMLQNWNDINDYKFIKGEREVYAGFIY